MCLTGVAFLMLPLVRLSPAALGVESHCSSSNGPRIRARKRGQVGQCVLPSVFSLLLGFSMSSLLATCGKLDTNSSVEVGEEEGRR
jgi:hypothetical protein